MILIDTAVIAFANAMRIQSIVGNTCLIIEAELFCQPDLRAKWIRASEGRPAKVSGLAVDEHIVRLREQLMPLVERFHRLGRESIDAIGRARHAPSLEVEGSKSITVVLV